MIKLPAILLFLKVGKRRDKLQKKVDRNNTKADKKGWSDEKKGSKIGNKSYRVASLDASLQWERLKVVSRFTVSLKLRLVEMVEFR